jgi:hypothetical protein
LAGLEKIPESKIPEKTGALQGYDCYADKFKVFEWAWFLVSVAGHLEQR